MEVYLIGPIESIICLSYLAYEWTFKRTLRLIEWDQLDLYMFNNLQFVQHVFGP